MALEGGGEGVLGGKGEGHRGGRGVAMNRSALHNPLCGVASQTNVAAPRQSVNT